MPLGMTNDPRSRPVQASAGRGAGTRRAGSACDAPRAQGARGTYGLWPGCLTNHGEGAVLAGKMAGACKPGLGMSGRLNRVVKGALSLLVAVSGQVGSA